MIVAADSTSPASRNQTPAERLTAVFARIRKGLDALGQEATVVDAVVEHHAVHHAEDEEWRRQAAPEQRRVHAIVLRYVCIV